MYHIVQKVEIFISTGFPYMVINNFGTEKPHNICMSAVIMKCLMNNHFFLNPFGCYCIIISNSKTDLANVIVCSASNVTATTEFIVNMKH